MSSKSSLAVVALSRIAVVGAHGAVGREILSLLAEEDIPVAQVTALAADRSVGQPVSYGEDEELTVEPLDRADFTAFQVVIFAVESSIAAKYARKAAAAGALVIDTSAEFRLDPDVPVIVPGVNDAALTAAKHAGRRLFACPNPLTIQLASVLKPLLALSPIRRAVVASYQGTSGAGRPAMDELFRQTRSIYVNDIPKPEQFTKQIAFNVIPHIGAFEANGATAEEQQLATELRKVLDPDLAAIATCVRVPVFVGTALAVTVELAAPVTVDAARAAWRKTEGLSVIDHRADEGYVTPVEAAGDDLVFLSRVREDRTVPHGLAFWCVSDDLRRGSARVAVDLLRLLRA